jgi:putative 4-mercaptohistidine N1-methyltranferase
MNIYETDRLLCEYLLFHYGEPSEVLPWDFGPHGATGFAVRAVTETFDPLPEGARALDLGCAVGRSSFELARSCAEVVGIDFSNRFIEAATKLRQRGALDYERTDEGALKTKLTACVPQDIDRTRLQFEVGNAMALGEDLGSFDAVLAANLVCRLSEPRRCLERLSDLVKPGGQLVITTPGTWMDEFTPRDHWLGGLERSGIRVTTLAGLREVLETDFELLRTRDLPFLIREHARKYQWSVAQASIWRRR